MKTAITQRRKRLSGRHVDLITDEELLERYRASGDRDAFAQLVKRYERELFN